jgi:hypothetical protein
MKWANLVGRLSRARYVAQGCCQQSYCIYQRHKCSVPASSTPRSSRAGRICGAKRNVDRAGSHASCVRGVVPRSSKRSGPVSLILIDRARQRVNPYKTRCRPRFAPKIYTPSMSVNDALANAQTKPGSILMPGIARVCLREFLENPTAKFVRDPVAMIRYRYTRGPTCDEYARRLWHARAKI